MAFQEQAAAIWKALDELSLKDPDAYQQFVKEQLAEGEKFFKANSTAVNSFTKETTGMNPIQLMGTLFNNPPSANVSPSTSAPCSSSSSAAAGLIPRKPTSKSSAASPFPAGKIGQSSEPCSKNPMPKAKGEAKSISMESEHKTCIGDGDSLASSFSSMLSIVNDAEAEEEDVFHLDKLILPGERPTTPTPSVLATDKGKDGNSNGIDNVDQQKKDQKKQKALIEEL